MSKTKFTPGPWEAKRIKVNNVEMTGTWFVGNEGVFIAGNITSGHTCGTIDEIQGANAKLMAAAPEMFEMLERCKLALLGCGVKHLAADIETLLAKARGE